MPRAGYESRHPPCRILANLNETCGCIVSFFRSDVRKVGNSFTRIFLTSPGAFVIEEDAVHSKEIVGLSEVHHNPVGIQFCCP